MAVSSSLSERSSFPSTGNLAHLVRGLMLSFSAQGRNALQLMVELLDFLFMWCLIMLYFWMDCERL